MKLWFWKKEPDPTEKRFREMDTHLRRIEDMLSRLPGTSHHITIENVHIHQPVLERLEFRLDDLDIEHLSGSLNLGNNFGAKVNPDQLSAKSPAPRKPDATKASNDQKETNSAPHVQPSDGAPLRIQHTPSGFRVKKS